MTLTLALVAILLVALAAGWLARSRASALRVDGRLNSLPFYHAAYAFRWPALPAAISFPFARFSSAQSSDAPYGLMSRPRASIQPIPRWSSHVNSRASQGPGVCLLTASPLHRSRATAGTQSPTRMRRRGGSSEGGCFRNGRWSALRYAWRLCTHCGLTAGGRSPTISKARLRCWM